MEQITKYGLLLVIVLVLGLLWFNQGGDGNVAAPTPVAAPTELEQAVDELERADDQMMAEGQDLVDLYGEAEAKRAERCVERGGIADKDALGSVICKGQR